MGALTFHAVSTFNAEGLEVYGRRMVESFGRNWPTDVRLTVYAERWNEDLGHGDVVQLLDASPWLPEFKRRHAHRPTKNFRMDAVRFSHKIAAVLHAALTTDADVLIWVDGDVYTHSPVTYERLSAMAPAGGEWVSWLDRAMLYPECGFYLLNLRHPQNAEMLASLEDMYAKDELFSLPEWHDCVVLEHVVKRAGVGVKSLSGAARSTLHPFVNAPILYEVMDHLKGPRKQAGKSHRSDLKVARDGAYWQ